MSDIKEIYKGVGFVGAGFTFLDKIKLTANPK